MITMYIDPDTLSDSEDLSEAQLEQLLKQAEARYKDQLVAAQNDDPVIPSTRFPKLDSSGLPLPYVDTNQQIAHADPGRLVDDNERQLAGQTRKVEDPVIAKRKHLETKKATAGAAWYNLPRTDLTPELKRDLQLLSMRSVLDPKRHYKKDNSARSKVPEFSQVGTLREGPTEWFSARVPNAQRKRTLVESVMNGEREAGRFKSKYDEIMGRKRSGKKGDFKDRMKKRYGRRYNG